MKILIALIKKSSLHNYILLLINFTLVAFALTGCEAKDPPLEGKRVNVLHYNLIESSNPLRKTIKVPAQMNNISWQYSDVGQYSYLPANISLGDDVKQTESFSTSSFLQNSDLGRAVVIAENIIYSYNRTELAAYDLAKGKLLWMIHPVASDERADVLEGAMAISGNIIYLSTGGKDFVAIDASNGDEKWRAKLPNVVSNIPLVSSNYVYVTSTDNKISCFKIQTGELKWRYNAALYSIINSRRYLSSIEYENSLITITTAGDMIILDKNDGREITEVNISTEAVIGDGAIAKGPISSPVLSNHAIYILTGENELIKIDLRNPGIAWRQIFPNARSFWVAGDAAYVLTSNNLLVAINDQKGELLWSTDLSVLLPEAKNHKFFGPILTGDKLLLTESNGYFFFLSPLDGSLKSTKKLDYTVDRMPIIVDKKIYFIGYKGKISLWQ